MLDYVVVCSHRYTFNIFIRIVFSVYNTTNITSESETKLNTLNT
jgi:hypothetical protein